VADPFDRSVVARVRRARNADRVYRPVFVAGVMGSGTSFLALLLAQRADCAGVIYESGHQVRERSFLRTEGPRDFASVQGFMESIRPRPEWSSQAGRDDLMRMYRSHASGPSDRIIDKGPNTNLVRAAFLERCCPGAGFIHLFRDPVANIEGLRRKWPTFAADSFEESLRFYRTLHEEFLDWSEDRTDIPAVSYSSLIADPEGRIESIRRELGMRPADRMRGLRTRGNVEGRGIRNVSRNRIGVVRDGNRRSIQRLEPAEIQRIRDALGPLHQRLLRRQSERCPITSPER